MDIFIYKSAIIWIIILQYSENDDSESELLGFRPLQESQQPRDDDNVEEDPSGVHSDTGSHTGEILITYGVAH